MLKKFKDLSEKEILALAIAFEEEDRRIYGEFADAIRESYPATAQMFEGCAKKKWYIATASSPCFGNVRRSHPATRIRLARIRL